MLVLPQVRPNSHTDQSICAFAASRQTEPWNGHPRNKYLVTAQDRLQPEFQEATPELKEKLMRTICVVSIRTWPVLLASLMSVTHDLPPWTFIFVFTVRLRPIRK
jgi:hypothetical protein